MNLTWSYSPETPNLGHIRQVLAPCDLEIWRMTLKNNRAPLLSNIKLCIISSSYVNSNSSYSPETAKLGCDLCDLDLWPRHFAWTLPWSVVITPENFVMIRWWEHSQKGVTDRQTDGQTENTILRAAWSQLKTIKIINEKSEGPIYLKNHWRKRLWISLHHWGEPHDGCSCNHRQHGRGRRWAHFNISVGVP